MLNEIDFTKEDLDFSDRSKMEKFIFKHRDKGNVYTGKNVDGEYVIVEVDGSGMTIKTQHSSKPKWLECVQYDECGYQTGIKYEPFVE